MVQWNTSTYIYIVRVIFCLKTLANQGMNKGKTIEFNVTIWGWHVLMEM